MGILLVAIRLGNVYSENMPNNANSVNIKNASRAYHHGDLRTALIEEGLRLLEVEAADALSLREVARNVGVSAPAVYRHFPDKAAFLRALAMEGLQRLGRAQGDVSRAGGAGGFAASGQAYVRFALANPGLFRLIFTSGAVGPLDTSCQPDGSAGWQLLRHVSDAIGPQASEDEQRVLAFRAWSLVHGLSMLILDGQIGETDGIALLDRIVSSDSIRV
jgi:AcrR family transcriptional regulator